MVDDRIEVWTRRGGGVNAAERQEKTHELETACSSSINIALAFSSTMTIKSQFNLDSDAARSWFFTVLLRSIQIHTTTQYRLALHGERS